MEFILYRVVYVANESKKKNEREKGGRNTQGKLLASGSWMTTLIQPSCARHRPAARRRRNCRSQIRASVIRGYCARLAWRKAGQAYTPISRSRSFYLSREGEGPDTSIKRIFRKRNYSTKRFVSTVSRANVRSIRGGKSGGREVLLVNGCFDKIVRKKNDILLRVARTAVGLVRWNT